MTTASATLTSKGQITVPRSIRRLLGLGPGSIVVFQAPSRKMAYIKPGASPSRLEGLLHARIRGGLRPPTLKDMDRAVADMARRRRG